MSEAVIADEKFDELESGEEINAVYLPPFMKDDRGKFHHEAVLLSRQSA